MKKIFLGVLALSLMTGNAVFAAGKKKAKAKAVKAQVCPATCPKSHCSMM